MYIGKYIKRKNGDENQASNSLWRPIGTPIIITNAFWPISKTKQSKTKLYLLLMKKVYLILIINRIKKFKNTSKPIIITNESYKFYKFIILGVKHWFIIKGRGEVFKNDKIIKK